MSSISIEYFFYKTRISSSFYIPFSFRNKNLHMISEQEGTSDDFFNFVFCRPQPKPKKSIQFQYLTDLPYGQTKSQKEAYWKEIFDFLLTTFTKAMQHFYRDEYNRVNLDQLSMSDIHKIQQYFESFGCSFDIEIYANRDEFEKAKPAEVITQDDEPSLSDYFFNFKTNLRYYHLIFKLI